MQLKPSFKYWIFLLTIVAATFLVILGSFIGSWLNLEPIEQELVRGIFHKLIPFPVVGALLLVIIIGILVSLLFKFYIIPILQLAEKARLIHTVNPGYRITPSGAREIHHLTKVINDAAEAYQRLQLDVDARVEAAQAELNEERNRLAALMSELPSGVLVCNTAGQILLYNQQAQSLLQRPDQGRLAGNWIGLGRSVFGVLERTPIAAGLELQEQALHDGVPPPPVSFLTTLADGTSLRAQLAPVVHNGDEGAELSGFVLTLEDITRQLAATARQEQAIRELDDALAATLDALQQAAADAAATSLGKQVAAIANAGRERLTQLRLGYPREAGTDPAEGTQAGLGAVLRSPPAAAPASSQGRSAIQDRPVFYAFDLFRQAPEEGAGRKLLRDLTYVVFDTETTGLDPVEDEVIQLGAIRIVKGRILFDETIDQLIDPRRPVPASSVAIHGIAPELLVGQPTLAEVLPQFRAFVEGAVLVAHNAAFDMRFLHMQQARTGIVFDLPVLDTLLLSSVVHPTLGTHALDAIAERLDIPIVGRHTALGDAIVTAEVLLKLIPLLEVQGIFTLEEAIAAASRSPYARIRR